MSEIKLFNKDCVEIMRDMPEQSVDLVVTDPPYGISYVSNMRKNSFGEMSSDNITNVIWLGYLARIVKSTGAVYCFSRWDVLGTWKHLFEFFGFSVKNCIVWDKERGGMGDLEGSYSPSHEMIIFAVRGRHLLNGKRTRDVVRCGKVSKLLHPTQKPPELLAEFIRNSSQEGDMIFDPFMGVGSTGKACKLTNRNFTGIEIEKKYYEIALQELSGLTQREPDSLKAGVLSLPGIVQSESNLPA
jgi:site-specific DNA-methyltransferase (adenine-specific)